MQSFNESESTSFSIGGNWQDFDLSGITNKKSRSLEIVVVFNSHFT